MPPHRFSRTSSARSTPLPSGRYAIPSTLPPTFGVHELFDWSTEASSASSRCASAGFATFQRHWQKAKPSPSVTAWIKNWGRSSQSELDAAWSDMSNFMKTPVAQTPLASTLSDEQTFFTSTPAKGQLFPSAPPSSQEPGFTSMRLPTPVGYISPQVPPQFPIVHESTRTEPNHYPASMKSNATMSSGSSYESFRSANTPGAVSPTVFARSSRSTAPRLSVGSDRQSKTNTTSHTRHSESVRYEEDDNTSDVTEVNTVDSVRADKGKAKLEERESKSRPKSEPGSESESKGSSDSSSEDESSEESEVESELSGNVRMRASRYIDCEAREQCTNWHINRETKRKKVNAKDETYGVGDRWLGGVQGPMIFRRRPNKTEITAPARWSFSNDGAARQPLKDREVGDIHFSPAYSGEVGDDYWVVVDHPKRRWAKCTEGQAHPTLPGYVLRPRAGAKAPQWIRSQSMRANKWRGRSN
ncbi:hypothetical protein FRC09_016170 [Ceratobasidium sp. 395]|nr:hypothetical protein FRC09_016170 [Ceratobasidium sp. 395]